MRLGISNERRAWLVLTLLLLVTSAFTLSFGHSFEQPTVPDERAYYGWARLFNEGYIAVPIEDWYGIDSRAPEAHAEIHVNGSGVHYLRLEVSIESVNGPREDDVRAVVTWEDTKPVPGAVVMLFLDPPRPPSQSVTDRNGTVTFLDVPPGVRRVVASLFRPPGPGTEPVSLFAADLVAVPPASTPYRVRLALAAVDGARVTVRAEDVFGTPVREASVILARKTPQGIVNESSLSTDEDGQAAFIVPGNGDYVLTGRSRASEGESSPRRWSSSTAATSY